MNAQEPAPSLPRGGRAHSRVPRLPPSPRDHPSPPFRAYRRGNTGLLLSYQTESRRLHLTSGTSARRTHLPLPSPPGPDLQVSEALCPGPAEATRSRTLRCSLSPATPCAVHSPHHHRAGPSWFAPTSVLHSSLSWALRPTVQTKPHGAPRPLVSHTLSQREAGRGCGG